MATSGSTSRSEASQAAARPQQDDDWHGKGHDVGPVLQAGPIAAAVLEAIRGLNRDVHVVDRGSYWRVSCRDRCAVSRAAIEEHLHRGFVLPGDLEQIMPSFTGFLHISDEEVSWELSQRRR